MKTTTKAKTMIRGFVARACESIAAGDYSAAASEVAGSMALEVGELHALQSALDSAASTFGAPRYGAATFVWGY